MSLNQIRRATFLLIVLVPLIAVGLQGAQGAFTVMSTPDVVTSTIITTTATNVTHSRDAAWGYIGLSVLAFTAAVTILVLVWGDLRD